MNAPNPINREDRCPAMSYTEMLEGDTRRVLSGEVSVRAAAA